jgi:hypothetical protein
VDHEVVEHHHISRLQGGHEHLLDIGEKLTLSMGPSNTAGAPILEAEGGDDRVRQWLHGV